MKYSILAFAFIFLISCADDEDSPKDYTAENEQEILDYIASSSLEATATGSGLYYVINYQGNGEQPTSTDNVTVSYKGFFTDNVVFDESDGFGISFNLQQVIAGWTEGIPYFNEGGDGLLLIPSHLAYGNEGRGSIPGGAVLIFEVRLISIN